MSNNTSDEEVNLSQLPNVYQEAVESIRKRLPENLRKPKWAIVCGSGLSSLAKHIVERVVIEYDTIPGFSSSTVQGHKSALAFGFLISNDKKVPIVAALGRFHLYEGHSAQTAVFPVRIMHCLGAKAIVITNAAGTLRHDWKVGTIMGMHDHIGLPSLTSLNPLVGPNFPLGTRFPPMSEAYDSILRLQFFKAAKQLNILNRVESGTYACVIGPSYESRAESRYLRQIGADAVGMSTVPELIAARQMGMRVLAISLITNQVVVKDYFDAKSAAEKGMSLEEVQEVVKKDSEEAANHEEVLQVGELRTEDIRKMVEYVICNTPI